MPSGQSMEVRVFDVTSATLVQDWTAMGVVERVVDAGLGISNYYYTVMLNSGEAYIIDWRNRATPTQVASETLSNTDTWLDASVAAVSGGAASVVLPPIQGQVYTAVAVEQQTVRVVQGDTPTLTFNLGANYTGWTAEFGAALPLGGALVMPVRNAAWTNAAQGQGNIALTAADTARPGSYYAELKLLNGAQVLTAIKFTVQVLPSVIQ